MAGSKQPKEELILSVAKELFWKHGFKRVSVEEICTIAEISKMTFYRFFPNKIELAKTVFENVMNEGNAKFHKIINDKTSAEIKMKNLLLLKLEGTNEISKEFLKDFYSSNESGLLEFIQVKTNEAWQSIIKDFRKAQKKGIFRKDFKPEILLFIAQKITDIFNDPDVVKLYKNPQDVIMEVSNLFIYGISPRKKSK